MIPQARFIPADIADKHGGSYEINHDGVVLRFRDGKPEHIGGITMRHEKNYRADGKTWDFTYTVHEDPLPATGGVFTGKQDDVEGYWLVPDRHIAAFTAAVEAAASKTEEG